MKIEELKILLEKSKITSSSIAILTSGTPQKEQLCLSFERGMWEVYYYERGNKNNLGRFLNEDDACAYLIKMMKNDGYVIPTVLAFDT